MLVARVESGSDESGRGRLPPSPVGSVSGVDNQQGYARFAGLEARRPVEMVDLATDPQALQRGGTWFVVAEFEGRARAWRFADVTHVPVTGGAPGGAQGGQAAWVGPRPQAWSSSLDREAYVDAVRRVREHVRAGTVYQANICRVLDAPLPRAGGVEPDPRALADRLAAGNPAPYQGVVHVPAASAPVAPGPVRGAPLDPVWVVTASPELYLRVDGLAGSGPATITSAPIKGTARTVDGLTAKDEAENVMITDLVRNDLQRVCSPGTVTVTTLLDVEEHPGLVHLVSTVTGQLLPQLAAADDLWATLLTATFPPASVSGAPKSSALRVIDELETAPRGPYCGAVGWVDADAGTAELAVGIRTFWWSEDQASQPGRLRFGTGAGITWGSDPEREWDETELKAARLIALASAAD